MGDTEQQKTISTSSLMLKTAVPVVIGLAVVVWLFADDFSVEQFKAIPLTARTLFGVVLALLFVAGREWGMMWRWRVLTDRQLSWAAAFRTTMLCEFTSAITPTTAGGTALSMFFLNREGISLGRAASYSMTSLLLDQLFVVVACPIIFLVLPSSAIFGFAHDAVVDSISAIFWTVYAGVCLVAVVLYLGVFVAPHKIAALLSKLFSLRWLRRWKEQADETGRNMIATGAELRSRDAAWWTKAAAATAITWVCRYLVVNAIFFGFAPMASQAAVFARQFVVWTILTVSPTPGGSGISEYLFTVYYSDLIGDKSMTLVIALIWRLITYYIYLAAGIFLLPTILRRKKRTSPSTSAKG